MRCFNFPLLLLQKHRCQQSQSRAPHGCESNVVSKTGTPMSSPLRSPIEYVTETPAAFTPDELARVPQHILNRLRQLAATVSTALEEENYRRQHQSVHSSDQVLPPASRALLIADSRRLLYNALQDNHPRPELSDARILALATGTPAFASPGSGLSYTGVSIVGTSLHSYLTYSHMYVHMQVLDAHQPWTSRTRSTRT